jgi:thiol-disulfide isomerase/thioredoxin
MSEQQWGDRESLSPDRPASPLWPWLALALAALVGVVYLLLRPPQRQPSLPHPLVGQPLSTLELSPLVGTTDSLKLEALRGKVVFIHFWGPWCGPCAMEFPQLLKMNELLVRQPDFQFVSISYPREEAEDKNLKASTAGFLQRFPQAPPTHSDPTNATIVGLARQMQQTGDDGFAFPTSVVIDRNAIIRGLWVGYHPGADQEMLESIEQALNSPPPPGGQ